MSADDSQRLSETVTLLLRQVREGDAPAREDLFRLLQDELRGLARSLLRQERPDHTLQPSALINEAVMKLLATGAVEDSPNRRYLFGAAVQAMKQVLIDHSRRKKSQKRGGDWEATPLDSLVDHFAEENGFDFDDLNVALEELAAENTRQREVIEHRFFGGLSNEQTAALLGVSLGTIERDLRLARAKLYKRLKME